MKAAHLVSACVAFGAACAGIMPSCAAESASLPPGQRQDAVAYQINTAQFGPKITVAGINGTVAATAPLDGCAAITNPSAIAGRIALIDRGTCNFTVKVKNAQLAGATAVIIADNNATGIPPMGGSDPTVTIPSIGVSQADGAAIRAAIPTTVSALQAHPKMNVPRKWLVPPTL